MNTYVAKGRLVIPSDKLENGTLQTQLEEVYTSLLLTLGADLSDNNFADTPSRMARAAIDEFRTPPLPNLTDFDEEPYDGMITVPRHEVWVRCPHHFERVRMIVGVSYVPSDRHRVLGLSKLPRICDYFAAGCILQETYTRLVADAIESACAPLRVGVYTTAYHQCMQARGVKTKSPVKMKILRGIYMHSPATRDEFLREVDNHER